MCLRYVWRHVWVLLRNSLRCRQASKVGIPLFVLMGRQKYKVRKLEHDDDDDVVLKSFFSHMKILLCNYKKITHCFCSKIRSNCLRVKIWPLALLYCTALFSVFKVRKTFCNGTDLLKYLLWLSTSSKAFVLVHKSFQLVPGSLYLSLSIIPGLEMMSQWWFSRLVVSCSSLQAAWYQLHLSATSMLIQ